jgi:tryptophan synthase beta chain
MVFSGADDYFMGPPDKTGHYGEFGGRYVPEALMPACLELEEAYVEAWSDPKFVAEFTRVLQEFGGRPTPVTYLARLSERLGVKVFAKREDLAHTGSHKINNVIGQTLLTQRMGKTRVIAETGAGQHGVATATAAARLGLSCTVYMGEVDTVRQELNVFRMELLGAKVVPVTSGSRTLKDAVNEAMREWVSSVSDTHYCIGSVMGPHPFPLMVREFQSIIGSEAAEQLNGAGVGVPDYVVACVGGGSNAAGVFSGFAWGESKLIGVEAAGGSAVGRGSPGVLHGMKSLLIQDEFGQIEEAHSISAGLDYPGIGPEHAYLAKSGRAEYVAIGDEDVIPAMQLLSELEGIIPALESSHAVAWIVKEAGKAIVEGSTVLLNLSGRGDKDVAQVRALLKGQP